MDIKKAVITAAGRAQRTLPLQTLVDRDGTSKSALRLLLEEILAAGVESVGIVICPGDEAAFTTAAGPHAGRIRFLPQPEPLGLGHAVSCAASYVGSEAFLLLMGDHLYLNHGNRACAQQLLELARAEGCSVSAVQATHESKLPYYGAVGGRLDGNRQGIYRVDTILEKPTPTEAEQELIVPGLRTGHYLCFFGMHLLTPGVFELLQSPEPGKGSGGCVSLADALARLATRERYLAVELSGRRFDIGAKYGLLMAQLALAIEGADREEVLASMVELLALRATKAG